MFAWQARSYKGALRSKSYRHPAISAVGMPVLPEQFLNDLLLAQCAHGYFYSCVLLLALFLQTPLSNNRVIRTVAGLLITVALLVGQPFIYDSPTQTYGIGLASMCCLGAWTLLHWTFIEPLQRKPSVMEVLMSTVTHPMTGVLKVFRRTQRRHAAPAPEAPASLSKPQAAAKASTGVRPLVVVDAAGDMQVLIAAAAPTSYATAAAAPTNSAMIGHSNTRRAWLLLKCLASVLVVCASYDVGLHMLCSMSNGMYATASTNRTNASNVSNGMPPATLPSGAGTISWLLLRATGLLHSRFVSVCLFGYVAGSLLPLQMEAIFCCMRAGMLAGGFFWPALLVGGYAEQLPSRAFASPSASKSITELWGFRWHQFLRFYFEGLGYTVVDKLLPKGKVVSPALHSSLHTVSAFFMSAVIHEYLTWAAFGTVTGCYMAFFGLHCAAVLLEGWAPVTFKAMLQRIRQCMSPAAAYQRTSQDATDTTCCSKGAVASAVVPKKSFSTMRPWIMRVWAVVVMALLSPLFVEPYRSAGYFAARAWHPCGAPVTPHVLAWAEHLHAQLGFAEVA